MTPPISRRQLHPEGTQRYEWDCFLACITMAVKGNYDKLWCKHVEYPPGFSLGASTFVDRMIAKQGIYGDDVDKAFAHAGLVRDADYWLVPIPQAAIDCTKQLLRARRAILQVPSLNLERGTHIVYWDGQQVHDPSPKQKYHWLQGMLIQNVWLLKGERP